jgi:hypothetical protein
MIKKMKKYSKVDTSKYSYIAQTQGCYWLLKEHKHQTDKTVITSWDWVLLSSKQIPICDKEVNCSAERAIQRAVSINWIVYQIDDITEFFFTKQ